MPQANLNERVCEQIEADGVDGTSERALHTLCLIAACHPSLERELDILPMAERHVSRTAPIVLAHLARRSSQPQAASQENPNDSPPSSPAATPKLTIATSIPVEPHQRIGSVMLVAGSFCSAFSSSTCDLLVPPGSL